MSPPWGLDDEEVEEEEEEEKGLKFLPMRLDPMRRKGSLVGAEEESSTYKKGASLRFESQTRDTQNTPFSSRGNMECVHILNKGKGN